MRPWRKTVPQVLCAALLATGGARANPGDIENAQDYPGFVRQPGYVITDYDEDNPAECDFAVSRPLPLDANHVEMMHLRGHRYVIRYEVTAGATASGIYQTQRYYEKLATAIGFEIAKGGAVGDVTETFYHAMPTRDVWVYLVPNGAQCAVTVIETAHVEPPAPPAEPRLVAAPKPATVAVVPAVAPAVAIPPAPHPNISMIHTEPGSTSTGPENAGPSDDPNGDQIFQALTHEGRVVVPFNFKPGREELDASSQPLVNRIVAMMTQHPDLFLRIEGHTDNTGDPENNLRLSAQRALAVQAVLMGSKIDRGRLDAVGVGGLQPRADNTTAEGREKNRRIELVMWKKYPAMHPPGNPPT